MELLHSRKEKCLSWKKERCPSGPTPGSVRKCFLGGVPVILISNKHSSHSFFLEGPRPGRWANLLPPWAAPWAGAVCATAAVQKGSFQEAHASDLGLGCGAKLHLCSGKRQGWGDGAFGALGTISWGSPGHLCCPVSSCGAIALCPRSPSMGLALEFFSVGSSATVFATQFSTYE